MAHGAQLIYEVVCVFVRLWEREREGVWVCVCACACECEEGRERWCVANSAQLIDVLLRVCVCVCVRERERECVCVRK